jgi:SAM-dependent methyltransferase
VGFSMSQRDEAFVVRPTGVIQRSMSNDNVNNGDAVINPGLRGPRRHEDFDTSYQTGTPPWDIGRPQTAFVRLLEAGEVWGRVLDVGCGTGEQALMAAAAGFVAMGIDSAPTAIGMAREKAAQRSLEVDFEVGDALELSGIGTPFDTVLDCGLFHVFDDDDRARFVASLGGVMAPGGRYFMLCFSDKQPGDWGPRRVSQDELRRSFTGGWRVDSIEETVLEITLNPEGAKAWLASFTKV